MRVIPDDVHVSYAVIDNGRLDYSSGNPMYHQDQTIEVTDKELKANQETLEINNKGLLSEIKPIKAKDWQTYAKVPALFSYTKERIFEAIAKQLQ